MVWPPWVLMIAALAALELPKKVVMLEEALLMLALAALELVKKLVLPPSTLLIATLAALELFWKLVVPPKFTIVCVLIELFTMPTPTKEKIWVFEVEFVVIVKGLAPGLNVMESMVTSPERNSEVIVEVLNVAVSPALTGGIAGVQLPPVFQSTDDGFEFHTASTASAGAAMATTSRRAPRAVAKNP